MGLSLSSALFFPFTRLSGFMADIVNLTATTELQAVNAMLSAIGEQPVATVDTARADVELAVNTLRDRTRSVLNEGWKFNSEFGLGLAATSTSQAWTDPDGAVKTLYVFKPPTGLARWELSMISEQADFDVTVRPSKVYVEAALPVLVFYDRENNRDGFENSKLKSSKLWIDAVWYFNFEQLPDVARRYITISAARQFIVERVADTVRAGFTAADEADALRKLRAIEGDEDEYSLLDGPDVAGILGGRLSDRGRALDNRSNP